MFLSQCIITKDENRADEYVTKFCRENEIHALDTHILKSTEGIGIGEVRTIWEQLKRKPFAGTNSGLVIWADTLSLEAQQALLKTLEEPPPHTRCLLIGSGEQKLLQTIISRCQIHYLDTENSSYTGNTAELSVFWHEILSLQLGLRLEKTAVLSSDRIELKTWAKNQLGFFHQELVQSLLTPAQAILKMTPQLICQILRQLILFINLLERNISVKLALDHLFLKLPHLSVAPN